MYLKINYNLLIANNAEICKLLLGILGLVKSDSFNINNSPFGKQTLKINSLFISNFTICFILSPESLINDAFSLLSVS